MPCHPVNKPCFSTCQILLLFQIIKPLAFIVASTFFFLSLKGENLICLIWLIWEHGGDIQGYMVRLALGLEGHFNVRIHK